MPKTTYKKTLIIICVTIIALTALSGYWQYSLILATCIFLFHELLYADHIFYNPKQSYQYQLNPDESFNVFLPKIKAKYQSTANTWLLPIKIKSNLLGRWFDPYITIEHQHKSERQYFERGLQGLRYINLSGFVSAIQNLQTINLSFSHCHPQQKKTTLIGFKHPDYTQKKMLIIAPHADDAEIAAFGLYSSTKNVYITTLSAGETEMQDYLHINLNASKASRLKGRLRAIDSTMIPLLGGVKPDNCWQLGYFCKQLKKMHQNPNTPVQSLTADLNNTLLFRQYNQQKLLSDQHGSPTWNTLVQDLTEIIEKIQPQVIVTPHSALDSHADHIYGTEAVHHALKKSTCNPETILYYANHYRTTDCFPFGPEHTIASLPPTTVNIPDTNKIYSFSLKAHQQQEKILALNMMHDLNRKVRLKKKIRQQLFRLIGRKPNRYGQDAYFRKAIKNNELFYCVNLPKLDNK